MPVPHEGMIVSELVKIVWYDLCLSVLMWRCFSISMSLKNLKEEDVTRTWKTRMFHKRRSSLGRSIIMWLFIHGLGSEDSSVCVYICIERERDREREKRHFGISFLLLCCVSICCDVSDEKMCRAVGTGAGSRRRWAQLGSKRRLEILECPAVWFCPLILIHYM